MEIKTETPETSKEWNHVVQLIGDIESTISQYYNKEGIDNDELQMNKITDILFVLALMLKKLAVVAGINNKTILKYLKGKLQDKGLDSMFNKSLKI